MPRMKITIFPDLLTHYRVPVFSRLAKLKRFQIVVYSPVKTKVPNIKLISDSADSVPFETSNNFNIEVGRFRIWQTKQISSVLNSDSDVVVIWGAVHVLSSWIALILGQLVGKRVVLWSHGLYGKERWWLKNLRYIYYLLADGLLLYGAHSRALLSSMGYPRDRMWVINNSLDINKQKAIREALACEDVNRLRRSIFSQSSYDTIIGIFVGRLTSVKRLEAIASMVAKIRLHGVDFKFLFVGSGPSKSGILNEVRKCGQEDNIKFVESEYDEKQLARYFLASDLFVSPGNVGLGCMHAMVYGVPVASNKDMKVQMPEAEAICPSETGFVFDPDNVDDFVERFVEWSNFREHNLEKIRSYCFRMIDQWYSLDYQSEVFKDCMLGNPQSESDIKKLPSWIM